MCDIPDRDPADARPAASMPGIDRAKVDRLKAAIAAGTYVVDAPRVADALLEQGFPGALTDPKFTETAPTDVDR